MIKVLIADDEKKICRLIEMLCDWESLGMEIIGYVHNGPEAIEMISESNLTSILARAGFRFLSCGFITV